MRDWQREASKKWSLDVDTCLSTASFTESVGTKLALAFAQLQDELGEVKIALKYRDKAAIRIINEPHDSCDNQAALYVNHARDEAKDCHHQGAYYLIRKANEWHRVNTHDYGYLRAITVLLAHLEVFLLLDDTARAKDTWHEIMPLIDFVALPRIPHEDHGMVRGLIYRLIKCLRALGLLAEARALVDKFSHVSEYALDVVTWKVAVEEVEEARSIISLRMLDTFGETNLWTLLRPCHALVVCYDFEELEKLFAGKIESFLSEFFQKKVDISFFVDMHLVIAGIKMSLGRRTEAENHLSRSIEMILNDKARRKTATGAWSSRSSDFFTPWWEPQKRETFSPGLGKCILSRHGRPSCSTFTRNTVT